MTDAVSWVVGRGGMLGRRVESALGERGSIWCPPAPFCWDDPLVARRQMEDSCSAFAREVGDRAWKVAWCAGAGVVGSGPTELQRETKLLSHLLDGLHRAMDCQQLQSGQFFLASSAGGVYAGSSGPPYTERCEERPLAPYGFNKLKQESIVRRWSADTGTPALIGRLSNIYGPGQKLSKSQGVISQVCRSVLVRQPFVLYVPPDTIRDYLFVDDAGALIADGLDRLRREHLAGARPRVVLKIFASMQPSTIATVLGEVRRISRRPVRVVLATSPSARHQASDLRMHSVEWPELDRRPTTTLSAGMRTVMNDILNDMQQGRSLQP